MKKRKENDIPDALLQNQEPAKKRSKLVLPSPQITDQVLGQIRTPCMRLGICRGLFSVQRVFNWCSVFEYLCGNKAAFPWRLEML